mmetsp:Transcript_151487/g.486187  ORF Transcript_151487/g.486187 Transcript_151487/m.486187 type:complete len:292 (-) Transcript_151487:418-1293(-)
MHITSCEAWRSQTLPDRFNMCSTRSHLLIGRPKLLCCQYKLQLQHAFRRLLDQRDGFPVLVQTAQLVRHDALHCTAGQHFYGGLPIFWFRRQGATDVQLPQHDVVRPHLRQLVAREAQQHDAAPRSDHMQGQGHRRGRAGSLDRDRGQVCTTLAQESDQIVCRAALCNVPHTRGSQLSRTLQPRRIRTHHARNLAPTPLQHLQHEQAHRAISNDNNPRPLLDIAIVAKQGQTHSLVRTREWLGQGGQLPRHMLWQCVQLCRREAQQRLQRTRSTKEPCFGASQAAQETASG